MIVSDEGPDLSDPARLVALYLSLPFGKRKELFVPIPIVAQRLGVTPQAIYRWIEMGRVVAIRVGERNTLAYWPSVERFLTESNLASK